MEVGAVSFVDVESSELRASVILDEARGGAANPWAVCWTGDGQRLCITHAGTQRRHWESKEHEEPAAGASDAAGDEPGGEGNGGASGAVGAEAYLVCESSGIGRKGH